MKYILQIFAALLYTAFYTGLIAFITIRPVIWLFSLPTFWMVVILVFMFGIFQGLIHSAQSFVTIPYIWIVKGNKVSLVLSLITFVAGMISICIRLWMTGPSGFWEVLGIIALTGLLIEVAIGVILNLLSCYSEK